MRKQKTIVRLILGKVWSWWGRLLRAIPGKSIFSTLWAKMGRWLWLSVLVLSLTGCAVNTTKQHAQVVDHLTDAKTDLVSATSHLDEVPPNIPAAKEDITSATQQIDNAIQQTTEVGVACEKAENRVKELEQSFWSPRQKHWFWGIVVASVLLGILAAVGNVAPGWWSLPALWAIKAARFVIFAGIPHVIGAIVWAFKKVFKRSPEPVPLA